MGTHLCRALLNLGYPVRAFDRPVPPELSADRLRGPIEWVYGDFLNRKDVVAAVQGCEIIFHLISTTLPKNSNDNPIYDVESNLIGTLALLEAARTAQVKRLIFASSGGTVYGKPEDLPITESHAQNPICAYGITKIAIEKYLHLYHELHGLNYLILRIANPFGEEQRPDAAQGAIAVFLNRALNGETIEIWGDGSVTRDYVYVGDVTQAFVQALDYHGECRVMNIGSGRGHSLNEILSVMEDALGRPVARTYLPARPFDVPVNVLDSSRAKDLLGWVSHTSLRDGLLRTVEWLKRSRPNT